MAANVPYGTNARFAEVHPFEGGWHVILHESFEAWPSAGEQEFRSLNAEAERYIRSWVEEGKVCF